MSSSTTPTPMSYDRFKPKFPLDPFATIEPTSTANPSNARAPWTLDADALPSSALLQNERRVILIIGRTSSRLFQAYFTDDELLQNQRVPRSTRYSRPSTLRLLS